MVIGEETGHWRSSYSPQFRNCLQKIRLRLLQLSNKPAMLVAINRFSSFYRLSSASLAAFIFASAASTSSMLLTNPPQLVRLYCNWR
jgi:hypothetical protein